VKSQSSRELKGPQDEPEGHRGLCAILALGFAETGGILFLGCGH